MRSITNYAPSSPLFTPLIDLVDIRVADLDQLSMRVLSIVSI